MSKLVGFDQKILLHHLDFTAKHTKNHSRAEMYELLDGYLRADITGTKSRKNAATMLMKIWFLVDEEMIETRDQMLSLLQTLTKDERLLIHWGMTLAAYPFFKDEAFELGRLFRLQDEIQSSAIVRRMKATYGDRRRVEVASSAVFMSMREWDVLVQEKRGYYTLSREFRVENIEIQSFVIQILLHILDVSSLQLKEIQNHPLFFPFNYDFNTYELRQQKSLVFYRQGVDTLVVERK